MRAVWGQWEWNLAAILTPMSKSSTNFDILLFPFDLCSSAIYYLGGVALAKEIERDRKIERDLNAFWGESHMTYIYIYIICLSQLPPYFLPLSWKVFWHMPPCFYLIAFFPSLHFNSSFLLYWQILY